MIRRELQQHQRMRRSGSLLRDLLIFSEERALGVLFDTVCTITTITFNNKMRRLTQPTPILDSLSATDIYSALRHLQALSRLEIQEQRDLSAVDMSFNQERSYSNISQRKLKNHHGLQKAGKEPSMSFQLYQSKRRDEKVQKTARKKPAKELEEVREVREIRVNPKSISIIKSKEDKGEKWLPIHLRTQADLDKKKKNIQRLRTELEGSKVDQSIKECTFKPRLNPASEEFAARLKENNSRRIENIHTHCSSQYKRQHKENVLISSRQIQEAFTDRKHCSKGVTTKKQSTEKSRTRIKTEIAHDKTVCVQGIPAQEQRQKVKNKSFNVLLDMIK